MQFPRWAVLLLVAVIATVGYAICQALNWAGTGFCVGTLLGAAVIYFAYGCWRVDDFREGYKRHPAKERESRYLKDRAIDPRLE